MGLLRKLRRSFIKLILRKYVRSFKVDPPGTPIRELAISLSVYIVKGLVIQYSLVLVIFLLSMRVKMA